jgi:hypothetical protein
MVVGKVASGIEPNLVGKVCGFAAAQGRLGQGISLGSLWLPVSYTPPLPFCTHASTVVCYYLLASVY